MTDRFLYSVSIFLYMRNITDYTLVGTSRGALDVCYVFLVSCTLPPHECLHTHNETRIYACVHTNIQKSIHANTHTHTGIGPHQPPNAHPRVASLEGRHKMGTLTYSRTTKSIHARRSRCHWEAVYCVEKRRVHDRQVQTAVGKMGVYCTRLSIRP